MDCDEMEYPGSDDYPEGYQEFVDEGDPDDFEDGESFWESLWEWMPDWIQW